MKRTNHTAIKLKDGTEIPSGTVCEIAFNNTPIAIVNGRRIRCQSLPRFFEFKTPSLRTLTKAMNDGICPSITGARVEPDGYDSHGAPSWLIALGMI